MVTLPNRDVLQIKQGRQPPQNGGGVYSLAGGVMFWIRMHGGPTLGGARRLEALAP